MRNPYTSAEIIEGILKMKNLKLVRYVAIPEGVEVQIEGRSVTVKGPRGELKKTFNHVQVYLRLSKTNQICAEMWHSNKKQAAGLRTTTAHIQNMITGVLRGFQYKMRLVYAHFPINVSIEQEGSMIEIRNFLGERRVREVPTLEGVKIWRNDAVKDEIVIEGNNLENVSQTAASIHQSCLVKNKDIRKFLDGIYVSEKGFVVAVE